MSDARPILEAAYQQGVEDAAARYKIAFIGSLLRMAGPIAGFVGAGPAAGAASKFMGRKLMQWGAPRALRGANMAFGRALNKPGVLGQGLQMGLGAAASEGISTGLNKVLPPEDN